MLYALGLFLPPLPLLLMGKVWHFLFSVILVCIALALSVTGVGLLFFIAPIVHAWAVIAGRNADRRTDKLVRAIEQSRK